MFVLPAFDPNRSGFSCRNAKAGRDTKRSWKEKWKRGTRRRVKQCEELWIRRSEIRPFSCILCAFFHSLQCWRSFLGEWKALLQPITKQKLLLFETFQLIYKSHSDKVPPSPHWLWNEFLFLLVFLLFCNISAIQSSAHTQYMKRLPIYRHTTHKVKLTLDKYLMDCVSDSECFNCCSLKCCWMWNPNWS